MPARPKGTLRIIYAKFAGWCGRCRKRITIGEGCRWLGPRQGIVCTRCSGFFDGDPEKPYRA